MHRGYFPLYRKFQDNPLWKEKRVFSKAEAWIDILWEARHQQEPCEVVIGMNIFTCNYGESLKSVRTWGKRWNWGEARVYRFFKLLEKMGQIRHTSETVTTRITILNYNKYNPKKINCETQMKHERNTSETRAMTDNNDKNEKNIETDFKFEKLVPIPKDIFLTDRMKEYVQKQGCDDLNHAEQLFEDFCINHKKRGTKWKDWTSAFYTWVRNDKKIYHPNHYKQKVYI